MNARQIVGTLISQEENCKEERREAFSALDRFRSQVLSSGGKDFDAAKEFLGNKLVKN